MPPLPDQIQQRPGHPLAPLDRALSLEPGQGQAILYSGRALLAAGRYEDAAARFREGASFPPPQQIRYVLGLAEAHMGQERPEEARAVLNDLTARHPKVAPCLFSPWVNPGGGEVLRQGRSLSSKPLSTMGTRPPTPI